MDRYRLRDRERDGERLTDLQFERVRVDYSNGQI